MGKGNRVSLYAYCPEPDKLLISGLFPYRKGQYLYEPPSSRGKTSKVIPPDYLKRIFLLTTLNGKESERMRMIEGSTDGINWVPYAMKTNEGEARAAASTCILKTKHTHVRIIEVKK